MKDTEFIEKVREFLKMPDYIKDEDPFENLKCDNFEYLGDFVDHKYNVSKLLLQYDNEKLVENMGKAV